MTARVDAVVTLTQIFLFLNENPPYLNFVANPTNNKLTACFFLVCDVLVLCEYGCTKFHANTGVLIAKIRLEKSIR